MKPWFEKESNVIPFPKPKAKVIQMPNVASYPDFLTGVKDLHNRKDKGEISQDAHDKLYTDLIHRFMKKESFETPWFLREYADLDQAKNDVISKIQNSDIIEIDAQKGTMNVKVSNDILNKRQAFISDTEDTSGYGRELFKLNRSQVSSSETGAISIS